MDSLSNLTGVGVAGLAVFLMWKLVANHLKHNTKAIQELTLVIKELREFIKGFHK